MRFVPSGAAGSATRHASGSRTVTVADGRLTVDATGGTNTKINYIDIASGECVSTGARPSVRSSNPANNATNVALDAPVTAEVILPNCGGIDRNTVTSSTVRLFLVSTNTQVSATVNSSGGGDVIVLQPTAALAANTQYRFEVTDGLHDLSGAAFLPYTSTFTTGTSGGGTGGGTFTGSFEKVVTSAPALAGGIGYTGVVIGPDGKLYAGTNSGEIKRFAINADGTLGPEQSITTIQTANGGFRLMIGMAFDPAATADNPILWVAHNQFAFNNATEWTGKITRLSGANLEVYQDVLVGLPRSSKDHLTNSVAWGPDGALYFTQGSNSAMGAPDNAWANRSERQLNGAVLRLDTSQAAGDAAARRQDRGRRRDLQPVRGERGTDDLRQRRPERLRPRLALQRPALRADERVGVRRQHAGHAQPAPGRLREPHRQRDERRLHRSVGARASPRSVSSTTSSSGSSAAATTDTRTRSAASGSSTAATRPAAPTRPR